MEDRRRPLEEVLQHFRDWKPQDLQELCILGATMIRANTEDNMVAVEKMSLEL